MGFSFLPSVAWKVNDQLSLGASLNAMYGIYKDNVAVNNLLPQYGDGRLKLKDERWGWGGNLGLLWEPSKTTRLGLTWNSQLKLDFAATPEFEGWPAVQFSGWPSVAVTFHPAGVRNERVFAGFWCSSVRLGAGGSFLAAVPAAGSRRRQARLSAGPFIFFDSGGLA